MTVTKRVSKRALDIALTPGSGNVFADLGLPNPEQELMKAELIAMIRKVIVGRGLTQSEAAKVLGIHQPQVSALTRYLSGNFSVERLLGFLTKLGHDVSIKVTPSRKDRGVMSIAEGR